MGQDHGAGAEKHIPELIPVLDMGCGIDGTPGIGEKSICEGNSDYDERHTPGSAYG
jgi:hypothetical protein